MLKNFDRKALWIIIALAWPTMLEQFLQTAVQYIDTAMVGALGTEATAAVGSTTTINWLINSTISAISIGFLAYISRAIGANNIEAAKKVSMQSVITTIICGIIFTAVTVILSPKIPVLMQVEETIRPTAFKYFLILYLPMLPRTATIIFGTVLRASGDTKSPLKISLLVNIVNIILNFLLIYPSREVQIFGRNILLFGAGMGVVGAAIASAVSFTVGGILITLKLFKHKIISPKGIPFKVDKKILIPCFKIAFPNMLQRFGTSLGYVAFATMINSLGGVATAAHTIANTVESAFYIPGYGMQTAAATLTGNALGAGNKKAMLSSARMINFVEVVLMVISGGLLFAFAPNMVSLFSKNSQVIFLGSTVLRMVALSEPFYGVSIVIEGMVQGVGNTKIPFIFNIVGMWGIRIFGTFICTRFLSLGLISAWGAMIAHNLLLFIMFFIYYITGKWNPFRS